MCSIYSLDIIDIKQVGEYYDFSARSFPVRNAACLTLVFEEEVSPLRDT
jgi:hypothetical protein